MKKLHITYKILRGGKVAEDATMDLPISETRYAELAKGLTPNNKAWQEVRTAIEDLAVLQGGNLGAGSIELEINGGNDND
ncbi:MAG: hypothetical protein LBT55_05330 [Clostridiaceae bacterium]|jgi:hypothetical protein|nr:hypothetical protein [Clostridiaceae bacterium]